MLVYLRAHDEASTIDGLVAALSAAGGEVVVVASGCSDDTALVAERAGARVLLAGPGMGVATCAALSDRDDAPRLLLDGDLAEVNLVSLPLLHALACAGRVGKGQFERPGRASCFLLEDAADLGVELPPVSPQSLTTAYQAWPAGTLERLDLSLVPAGYGADLALSVLAHRAGLDLAEVPVGQRLHADRGEGHVEMLRAANRATLALFAPGGSLHV